MSVSYLIEEHKPHEGKLSCPSITELIHNSLKDVVWKKYSLHFRSHFEMPKLDIHGADIYLQELFTVLLLHIVRKGMPFSRA